MSVTEHSECSRTFFTLLKPLSQHPGIFHIVPELALSPKTDSGSAGEPPHAVYITKIFKELKLLYIYLSLKKLVVCLKVI